MELEISFKKQAFRKAFGILVVVALFFGMCSPALPYIPEVTISAEAAGESVTDGNVQPNGSVIDSGKCGNKANYKLYENGMLVISGNGEIGSGYSFNCCGSPFWSIRVAIKNVIIEDGITHIDYGAFEDCTEMKSIVIPDSVTSISDLHNSLNCSAFRGCTSLESVKLSKNLNELSSLLFAGCTSLESIEIPDSVTLIDSSAFEGCIRLKSIEIPDSVKEIGSSSFSGCTNLEEIKLNEGLELIGYGVFSRCHSLENINLPSTVKLINSMAFAQCIYLEEVTIPESVALIDQNVFFDCIRLSKVTILNPDCEFDYARETFPETAIIYGYSDSTAEKYTKDWLRKFVPLDREHDHEYESKVLSKSTCTSAGEEEFSCYCGEKYTQVIPMNYHYDINQDDYCDICQTKLNINTGADNSGNTSDNPTDTPDNSGDVSAPEQQKSVFEKFLDSLVEFFRNFAKLFLFFKN